MAVTVCMAVALMVVGAALAGWREGRRRRPDQVPGSANRRPDTSELRQPAAARAAALLERHREHRWRAMGDATGERARCDADDHGDPGDPVVERPASVRDAAEAERPVLHAAVGDTGLDLRVPPDPQPLAHRRRGVVRGAQGEPDRDAVVGKNSIKVGFCLLDLYKLDDNAPTSQKTFWDCYTSYQGVSAGWVDQYHQATDGQEVDLTGIPNGDRLLPRVDDEPDEGLPRAGQDEQLRVGEVHALDRLERQPEGDRHRPLSVRERGALRRALGESLTRCGRGWCLSHPRPLRDTGGARLESCVTPSSRRSRSVPAISAAGQWGVATQSKFLAVGSVVPWAAPHGRGDRNAVLRQPPLRPGRARAAPERRHGSRDRRGADDRRRRPRAAPAGRRRRRRTRGDLHGRRLPRLGRRAHRRRLCRAGEHPRLGGDGRRPGGDVRGDRGAPARRAVDRLSRSGAGGRWRQPRPAVGRAARRGAGRRLCGAVRHARRPPRRRSRAADRRARAVVHALHDDAVRQDIPRRSGCRSRASCAPRSTSGSRRSGTRGSRSGRASRISRSGSTARTSIDPVVLDHLRRM